MSESDKSFTVSDRRHFTPDGRPREDGDGEEAATPRAAFEAGAGAGRVVPGPPVDFSHFVLGLATQAGALLGGGEAPGSATPEESLEAARTIISILEMLKDKTEGRRTGSEDALLEDLLFQLRMAYVEESRSGGA